MSPSPMTRTSSSRVQPAFDSHANLKPAAAGTLHIEGEDCDKFQQPQVRHRLAECMVLAERCTAKALVKKLITLYVWGLFEHMLCWGFSQPGREALSRTHVNCCLSLTYTASLAAY